MLVRKRSQIAFVATVVSVFMGAPVNAQLPVNTEQESTIKSPSDLRTLLERCDYHSQRRPLLVVIRGLIEYPKTISGTTPNEIGTDLNEIGDAFDRKVMRAGSITVLAPAHMINSNSKAQYEKPNPFKGMGTLRTREALLGSLTPGQWQILGTQGISLGDLDDDQKQMFAALMPERPARLTAPPPEVLQAWYKKSPGARFPVEIFHPQEIDPEQLRLRIIRRTDIRLFRTGNPDQMFWPHTPQQNLSRGFWLGDLSQPEGAFNAWAGQDRPGYLFGVRVTDDAPNTLKPSQIQYDDSYWDTQVSLDSTGLKTVDDLLTEVNRVTGCEIIADQRVGRLSIYLRAAPGTSARAGDILKALALSVIGAYRQLTERTFVLTADIKGIGTLSERSPKWISRAYTDYFEKTRRYLAPRDRPDFSDVIHSSPDDPLTIPDALYRKLVAHQLEKGSGERMDVPLAGLPDPLRQLLMRTDSRSIPPDVNRASLCAGIAGEWILPDGTTIRADLGEITFVPEAFCRANVRRTSSPAPKPVPIKPLPASLKRRIILLPKFTADAATSIMDFARKHTVSEFWVRVPVGNLDTAALQAAIVEGRKWHVPVLAVVPLYRDNDLGEPDRTISGETGDDYSRREIAKIKNEAATSKRGTLPDPTRLYEFGLYTGRRVLTESDISELTRRLRKIAGVEGLAGLVLCDCGGAQHSPALRKAGGATTLGYALSSRLAFLRSEAIDLVDVGTRTPFFNDSISHMDIPQWQNHVQQVRDDENRRFLAKVYDAIRTAFPSLPLYLDDRGQSGWTSAPWFASWDAADRLPKNSSEPSTGDSLTFARRTSQTVLRAETIIPGTSTTDFARAIGEAGSEAVKGWDGLVIDMSAISETEGKRLLEIIPLPP